MKAGKQLGELPGFTQLYYTHPMHKLHNRVNRVNFKPSLAEIGAIRVFVVIVLEQFAKH